MRNTLAFLGALLVVVAAVGWYLGWYQVFLAPGHSGHETVKIDIDTDKVKADLKKGEAKVLEEKDKLGARKDAGQAGGAKESGSSGPSLLAPPRDILEEQEPSVPPRPFDPSGTGTIPYSPGKPGSAPPLPTPFGGTGERK
jgi:hypothetical protein